MADNMRLYLELMGKSGGLRSELNRSKGDVRSWSSAVKGEFNSLRNLAGSLQGQLAALGVSFGVVRTMADSARLDKSLTRIKQTGSATAGEMALLRKELFTMARQTGQPLEELQAGFDGLVQSGLDWKSALESIKAVNIGSAVSGAPAQTLGKALTVAATAFDFDLAKPGKALELLDKMTVAGRQGSLELGDLAATFGRISTNAKFAGMGFEQTLAFAEGLSKWKPGQTEQLGTLVDSTMRVFTNVNYMKEAQKASGVRFFDKKGGRRDPLAVLEDIKKKYDTLKTDMARSNFIGAAFGKADQDTRQGIMMLMDEGLILKIRGMASDISDAGGTLNKNLDEATNNLIDQANMLKADLREAADGFVKPMNKTLGSWIKWVRESKDNGGAGLNGEDMIKYGVGGGLGALLLGRYGGKAAARLFSGSGGLAAGTVTGKAMEEFAGVTPVFVVNMPGSGIGGSGHVIGGGENPAKNMLPATMLATSVPLVAATATAAVGAMMFKNATPENAAWYEGYGAENGDLSALGSMLTNYWDTYREQEIKNDINLNVTIDGNNRVTTSSDDPNTKATVKPMRRGNFVEAN